MPRDLEGRVRRMEVRVRPPPPAPRLVVGEPGEGYEDAILRVYGPSGGPRGEFPVPGSIVALGVEPPIRADDEWAFGMGDDT